MPQLLEKYEGSTKYVSTDDGATWNIHTSPPTHGAVNPNASEQKSLTQERSDTYVAETPDDHLL